MTGGVSIYEEHDAEQLLQLQAECDGKVKKGPWRSNTKDEAEGDASASKTKR